MHMPHIYMHTCSRVPHTPIHICSHVHTRYTQIHRAHTCKRFPLDHHLLRCFCPQRGCSCNNTHTTLLCEVALKRFPLQEAEMSPEFFPKRFFFLAQNILDRLHESFVCRNFGWLLFRSNSFDTLSRL